MFFCRELADSITDMRKAEIARLQSELVAAWDTRTIVLSELEDAVVRARAGNVNDDPWESRLPPMLAHNELQSLLPASIGIGLSARLRDFVATLIDKVQRPLPVRPRGARDQCERVLSDLRDLFEKCALPVASVRQSPMRLETAWHHLPCVLWSETYIELVNCVNADTTTAGKHKATDDDIDLAQSKRAK